MKIASVENMRAALRSLGGFRSVMIPEFTYKDLRIDAIVLDIRTRWIRGFEIKVDRKDWLADEKWHLYTQFCSSLTIVCPAGLIQREEVQKPYGLLWMSESEFVLGHKWVRMPKRFQHPDGLSWLWTYLRVLEAEVPRLNGEIERLKGEIDRSRVRYEQLRDRYALEAKKPKV